MFLFRFNTLHRNTHLLPIIFSPLNCPASTSIVISITAFIPWEATTRLGHGRTVISWSVSATFISDARAFIGKITHTFLDQNFSIKKGALVKNEYEFCCASMKKMIRLIYSDVGRASSVNAYLYAGNCVNYGKYMHRDCCAVSLESTTTKSNHWNLSPTENTWIPRP